MTSIKQIPAEMTLRGVTVFSGLRTQEGVRLAQNFIGLFEAEPLRPDVSTCELFGIKSEDVPDRSYAERFDAARYDGDQQRLLAEIIEPFRDGGPITAQKALLIADLMQLADITPGLNEKVLMLMPDAFRNDDGALEDFGTVSQSRCFDPLYVYRTPAETGIYEMVLSGSDPAASLEHLRLMDEGCPSRSTPITHTDLAERFLQNPLALVMTLVEITRFVRDSNEASYATLIENYSPELLAIEREKEAKRLADYLLANAARGRSPK